ncbi:helix-hairpin-helix domain-containing protein [Qipengyuania flava]|uniref:helix-hairpin-helix domain-containing protein n=1 Tax=Qipengyuania flava TaxID=192812 RepID=UPI001C6254B1|nr:helix-hairpin-helix domain-containing protein [Qipengyuania flava]QYJ06838.1 helix-hairpin-helix domain-containing protein [Qipengyuania flava]
MRKSVLAAALSGTMLTLAACSGGAEEATETTEAAADAGAETEEATAEAGVLDASTATAEQLAAVEGVSEELAAAIVAGQPYASVTDLNAKLLETLGAEDAAAVLVNVFVPVNLNTATKDELKLIPGMTEKMEHEFEEYRPYEDMSEFDREIGKYVDEAEVARFKNYVTL